MPNREGVATARAITFAYTSADLERMMEFARRSYESTPTRMVIHDEDTLDYARYFRRAPEIKKTENKPLPKICF